MGFLAEFSSATGHNITQPQFPNHKKRFCTGHTRNDSSTATQSIFPYLEARAVSISIISFSLLLCRSDVCAIVVSYLIWLGIFSPAVIKIRHTQVRKKPNLNKSKKSFIIMRQTKLLVSFFPRAFRPHYFAISRSLERSGDRTDK